MKKALLPLLAFVLLASCSARTVEKQADIAMKALRERDMETLANLVHPVKGMRFTP